MLDELVLEILDLLSVPLTFHSEKAPKDSISTLLLCSLVCKTWSGHAQKLLFRRVYLDVQRKFGASLLMWEDLDDQPRDPTVRLKSFVDIVTAGTERGRFLAASVHALVLRAPSREHVAELLVSLPRLRELDLNGRACTLSTDDLARITAAKPDIRSLRLHADHLGQMPPICNLMDALPRIRMLDIDLRGYSRFESLTPRVKLQLVSLKLNSKRLSHPSAVMKQLGVVGLELYSQRRSVFTAPDVEELLAVHQPTLRSLTIPFELTGSYNLSRGTRLERLQLEVFPDEAGIRAIPLGVVAIAVGPTDELSRVTDFIAMLSSFTRLRVLTWISSPMLFTDLLRIMLQRACKERGIEFRVQHGDLSDDHIEYELRNRLLTV
ncbi:hypothetical protein C8F01DRAFT_668512 [Mycena amicta]|nr:hypothetical protein C8F01DRAFT_668512 [Mycena amicta]